MIRKSYRELWGSPREWSVDELNHFLMEWEKEPFTLLTGVLAEIKRRELRDSKESK